MKRAVHPVALPIGRRHPELSEPGFHISTGISGLPVESPLEIEVNGVPRATLLCTPDALEELVVGWCFSQGYVESIADLASVRLKGGRASIMLNRSLPGGHDWREQLTAGFDASLVRSPIAKLTTPPQRDGVVVPANRLIASIDDLFDRFRQSNAPLGNHFAGLHEFGSDAQMVFHDFSRHNATDKLIGWSVLTKLSLDRAALVLSGRVSSDLVYKAMRAGIKIIATRALPSAQAVRLAQGAGITIVARALDAERTIYTHPWRIDRNS